MSESKSVKISEAETVDRSQELIHRLEADGVFDEYNHQEVMSAGLFMIARAIRKDKGFSAEQCLRVIERTASVMHNLELETGMLQHLLETQPS